MLPYLVRRILVLPVIILLVTLILFLLILRLPPEVRAEIYMPSLRPTITEAERAEIVQEVIARHGLDQPALVQYTNWLRKLASGDWGYSPTWRQPILPALIGRSRASIELALYAAIPAIVLSLTMGSWAAKHYNKRLDRFLRAATFVGWAFPSFILGLILLNVLYAWLGWFPPERVSLWVSNLMYEGDFKAYTGLLSLDALLNGNLKVWLDVMRHLFLPAFTLGIGQWALLTRIMRSSSLQVLSQEYITTARAKGLSERRVLNRHARRNAVLPIISMAGVLVSQLISGVVVIEVVFNYRGIGLGAVQAILAGDVAATVGFTFFACIVTVTSNMIADVAYALIDPRVRTYGGSLQE